jgi:arginase
LEIKVITVEELREQGVNKTVNIVLDYLKNCDSIYVSFDIDSLDDSIVKGTGTPEPHGLSEGEAMVLITGLVSDEKVNCLELTEVNPILDEKNKTAEIAFRIVNESVKCIENN